MSKIKKIAIAALALIGAGVQAAPVANISSNAPQEITVATKTTNEKKQVKQVKEIAPDGFGGIVNNMYDSGTPPKFYGQHLQYMRRQKWNKKKRK